MRHSVTLKGEIDAQAMQPLLERRLARLRRRTRRFPSASSRLRLLVRRHPVRPLTRVALSLHLPSRTLATQEQSEWTETALQDAFDELERLLEKEKARLRGAWHWREARAFAVRTPPAATRDNDLAGLEQQLPRLESFVRREIALREDADELAPGEVDAEDVVEVAVLGAFDEYDAQRDGASLPAWLLGRARSALLEAVERHRTELATEVHLEADVPGNGASETTNRLESFDDESFQPPRPGGELHVEDVLPALGTGTPEELESAQDMLAALRRGLAALPRRWRESFTLAAIEGLGSAEAARLAGRPRARIEAETALARDFLREKLYDAGLLENPA